MGRRSDESGVPNTCPSIDEAIDELERCECDNVDIGKAKAALEKVRGYNDELRQWGNVQYQELQESERQVAKLESENEDLNDQIKDLCSEIRALESVVDDLKEIISDHQRLVRELDVVLNGEEGAAPQASLCDIVAQIRKDVAAGAYGRTTQRG